MARLLAAGLILTSLLSAASDSGQIVQSSHTERMDLGPSGTLRLQHSTGELTIGGWNESAVEITTVKATADLFTESERERANRKLDTVRITSERRGADVVIATALAGHHIPLFPRNADGVLVSYYIKVPRNAHLMVDHDEGEVHLEDLAGDIQASVHRGMITVRLHPDAQFEIDAKTKWGGIVSDFPGSSHHRVWRIGNEFSESAVAGKFKLHFRAGYGDILILKMAPFPAQSRSIQ
jgi:hypothetical protein